MATSTNVSEIIDNLNSLVQLDIDAVRAYQQAIDEIDISNVRDPLISFRQDHERHINDLSDAVRKLGGQPPEVKPDFKGFLLEGFTAIRSKTGTEGALRAMKINEKITNKAYRNAMAWVLPPDVYDVVRRNRDDEQRHLHAIDRMIQQRVWEEERKAA